MGSLHAGQRRYRTSSASTEATVRSPFTQTQSGINSMNIQFGGLAGPNRGRDAFVDDNIFAATESPTNRSQINGTDLPLPPTENNGPTLGLVSSVPNTALASPCAVN